MQLFNLRGHPALWVSIEIESGWCQSEKRPQKYCRWQFKKPDLWICDDCCFTFQFCHRFIITSSREFLLSKHFNFIIWNVKGGREQSVQSGTSFSICPTPILFRICLPTTFSSRVMKQMRNHCSATYFLISWSLILSKRRSPTNFPLWVRVVEEMGILSFLIVLRSDFEGTLHYQNNHHQCHFDLSWYWTVCSPNSRHPHTGLPISEQPEQARRPKPGWWSSSPELCH